MVEREIGFEWREGIVETEERQRTWDQGHYHHYYPSQIVHTELCSCSTMQRGCARPIRANRAHPSHNGFYIKKSYSKVNKL